MQVKIRFFALYKEITGQREIDVTLPSETTASALLDLVVAQHPPLRALAAISRLVVNRRYVAATTLLQEGDEVVFLPPVSGGDFFEITETPIAAEPLIAAVTDEHVGGVATFVGVVRGFSRGKRVRYLEYEAYKEMAEEQLAAVAAEIRRQWPVEHVGIRHRVGRLEIGETAIVIAVGSAHREEAFAACRFAIDRVKQTVPVWKKEVWEDGEVWVGMEGG